MNKLSFLSCLLYILFSYSTSILGGSSILSTSSESSSTGLIAICLCLSCTGEVKTRTGFSRWVSQVLTRREGSLYLDMPAEFLIMQPRRRLAFFIVKAHCLFMVNLLSTRTTTWSFLKLLSRWSDPSWC